MTVAPCTPTSPAVNPALHVEPGGPGLLLDLGRAVVRKISVGPMDNNVYLITDATTGFQILVDAADDPARIMELVAEGSGRLRKLLTTHRHEDHTRALREVSARTRAWRVAGRADAASLPLPTDRPLDHGDKVYLGELVMDIIELRGHTPGSIALALTPGEGPVHLFTGDSLFPGGPGRTESPEDFTQLMDDLEERVFAVYGDDTVIHPGHGDATTLGAERPHLQEWRQRGW